MVIHEYHGHTPYTIYLVLHYTQLKMVVHKARLLYEHELHTPG